MARYFAESNPEELLVQYPIGQNFLDKIATLSRDQMRSIQERRFLNLMEGAWKVPFYKRHWEAVGLTPDDIRSLDDLSKIPTFSKSDLMASVETYPPFGDFVGVGSWTDGNRVIMHTTSGTTGRPQPLFFGPRDREIQNVLLARAYLLQGLRSNDIVHSVYGFGMVNGGHYIREAILHYTDALLLPAGTGLETRSEQQIELIQRFGVTVLVGFSDYIIKLAEIARSKGLNPGIDLKVRMISGHLTGDGGRVIKEVWGGAEAYDWYGVGDTGIIAAEGCDRNGLYIWEDAHLVEIIDPETGRLVPDGKTGNICNTVLFKNSVYPVIRFDTKDVSAILPGVGDLGFSLRRLAGFQGRSDNMVKLRGINVYPTGIGSILQEVKETGDEYFCRLTNKNGQEVMTVVCEARKRGVNQKLKEKIAKLLRERLGVAIEVELVAFGQTAASTQIDSRQKPIRLIDDR